MGCSTFAEYAVLSSISVTKINSFSDPYQSCVLSYDIPTGWGVVFNSEVQYANSTVAVYGLNAMGLAIIQAAKIRGARKIYAIDKNSNAF